MTNANHELGLRFSFLEQGHEYRLQNELDRFPYQYSHEQLQWRHIHGQQPPVFERLMDGIVQKQVGTFAHTLRVPEVLAKQIVQQSHV